MMAQLGKIALCILYIECIKWSGVVQFIIMDIGILGILGIRIENYSTLLIEFGKVMICAKFNFCFCAVHLLWWIY